MKTAEEIVDAMFKSQIWSGDRLLEVIKQIQLDSMKAGMRRAANVMVRHKGEMSGGYKCGLMDKRTAILTAAEQLTEKDL